MTKFLTEVEGVPSSDTVNAARGMAFFPGTGPAGKTCGSCAHRGYQRQVAQGIWDAKANQFVHRWYHYQGCEMFKTLTGKHGPKVERDYRACKYFQQDVRR